MDATFRQRYLVELFTLWRAHRGGHGAGANVVGTMDWPVDLTPQLKALAGQHAGETWTATVALVRRPSAQPVGQSVLGHRMQGQGVGRAVDQVEGILGGHVSTFLAGARCPYNAGRRGACKAVTLRVEVG